MSTPAIDTGNYLVRSPCPECGTVVEVFVRLSSVLTVPQDDPPQLRVKCKGETVPHSCKGAVATPLFDVVPNE